MQSGMRALASALPNAQYRPLDGQAHNVKPKSARTAASGVLHRATPRERWPLGHPSLARELRGATMTAVIAGSLYVRRIRALGRGRARTSMGPRAVALARLSTATAIMRRFGADPPLVERRTAPRLTPVRPAARVRSCSSEPRPRLVTEPLAVGFMRHEKRQRRALACCVSHQSKEQGRPRSALRLAGTTPGRLGTGSGGLPGRGRAGRSAPSLLGAGRRSPAGSSCGCRWGRR